MPLEANIKKIQRCMKAKPGTIVELAKRAGFSDTFVREVIGILFNDGQCHIARYATRGKRDFPVYAMGAGINAPAPIKMTPEERRARNREYYAARMEKKENAIEASHKARIAAELSRPAFRDPLVAALFGEYERRAA
jgi:hypothetical protein